MKTNHVATKETIQ